MIDTKQIILARTERKYDTLLQLANSFNVTPSYVHQVLKHNNIPTERIKINKKLKYCLVCMSVGTRKICLGECYGQYYFSYVRCRNCQEDWHMKRSRLKQKTLRGDKNIYCSRACYFNHKLNN